MLNLMSISVVNNTFMLMTSWVITMNIQLLVYVHALVVSNCSIVISDVKAVMEFKLVWDDYIVSSTVLGGVIAVLHFVILWYLLRAIGHNFV